ncbi:ROK family protein [Streptomyces sp. NPDC047017]|uniref:ROK family protein n=1 Tax=Streptomyces sp. NPDC047017 TaxID=3155024 RepID=UPI0033FC227B
MSGTGTRGPAHRSGAVYAGVDIGGTTTQVLLCTPGLAVLDRFETATPAGGPAMLDAVLGGLRGLLDRRPARLLGVGVGAAGVVDARAGRVVAASDSFRDWAGFEVTATLEAALGVPAFLDNDVNAFLRGEVTGGAVAGEPDVLGMTLGTGVGGALWLGGALLDGPHGAAGEIGHIPGFGALPCSCGGRGHLETLAAGRSVAARYRERTGRSGTAREVAAAARGGDAEARAVFEAAGTGIGRALLMTAGLVDVTTAVLGGGVTGAWDLLEPAIRRVLAEEPPVSGQPVRLVRAGLGGDAVAVGAASRARAELARRPGASAQASGALREPVPDAGPASGAAGACASGR